ncbi:multicopper oxidase domain-containing protein [Legionella sp. PATHC038]|nr:multicopper oxidase domain-containing protein [Legionella sp. PATHC038]MCW8399420.1 multicopper oxidase domain-containing protein [Legionella sp. PATHC038]
MITLLFSTLFWSNTFAAERVINLVVGYKTVHFAGKARQAIAVNNQIPAPTLHFKQGDRVTINVSNQLDKGTAIHWHGLLVPWQMDGVEGVTQREIPPGSTFRYQFTLEQSGTYWYHAHAGLQEQQGLYGAFLIDPPTLPKYHYTKDYVVVLSDWSNTLPEQILTNLKKDGGYYGPRFPLQPSLTKFLHDYRKASKEERQKVLDDYKMMQQMRMSIYDINDVAYDAFLVNGHPPANPWTAPVKVGDVVRLRFIGAGGNTIFNVKIPDTTIQMVHAQGNDVTPYPIKDFTIAPGETYDVLVTIQKNKPYIIYAESRDTVGHAYGALLTQPNQVVNYQHVAPFPEPLPVTREMMDLMMGAMNQGSLPHEKAKGTKNTMPKPMNMSGMNMSGMDMSTMKNHPSSPNTQSTSGIASKSKSHSMSMSEGTHKMPMQKGMAMNDSSSQGMQHTGMTQTTSQPQHMEMNTTSQTQSSALGLHPMHGMTNEPTMQHGKHKGMSQSMNSMQGMNMGHGKSMNHTMTMPTEPTRFGDTIEPPNSMYRTSLGTKYQPMRAVVPTNDPNKPIAGVINMELFGYMDRFIWFINGVPEYKAKPIPLEPGKRYRMVFTNTSMMYHPMHIHGHWFILRKGEDAYDPLLHTISVPPGATMTADIDTDASGQWFFHCHLLYHMMAGMARSFQYTTLIGITQGKDKPQDIVHQTAYSNRPIVRVDEVRPIDVSLVKHPMAHHAGFWLATFLDVGADPFNNAQRLNYKGLYGPDYNKLELFVNDAELNKGNLENADIDIFYWHLISQFWAVKAGANYFNRPAKTPYWQPGLGIEGLMPWYIDTNVRTYYYRGSAKLDVELSRDTQITNNFFIRTGVRSILASKTVLQAELGSGLNQMRYIVRPYYRLMPGLNAFVEYENEQDYGAFKTIQQNNGDATSQNTVTFGLVALF